MRVVSENSESDIARNEAAQDVEWRLRELAANLLRVIRGAGKPYDLPQDAASFVRAVVAYQEAAGHGVPSDELSAMLTDAVDQDIDRAQGDESDRAYAERKIMRGCLQIAASRLLGQRTQESAGDSELYDGARDLEAWREEQRRQWAAKVPPRRSKAATAKKPATKKR